MSKSRFPCVWAVSLFLRKGDYEFCFENETDVVNFMAELVKWAQYLKTLGRDAKFEVSWDKLFIGNWRAVPSEYWRQPDLTKTGLLVGQNDVAYWQKDTRMTVTPTVGLDSKGNVTMGLDTDSEEYNRSKRTDRGQKWDINESNLLWCIANTLNDISKTIK